MPDLLVRSFAPFLLAFQPCFTRPSFASFWALTCAWILCSGRRSLTRIIQAAQLTDIKHYCSFHRFFSQARWNLDDLGRCVFQLLLPFCEEVLVASVDDTLARKSGRHIWGAGMHHDPLRSTQKRPAFSFGHNFVVFSLQVALPFAPNKYWAFPILVRMYRKRQTSQRAPGKGGKLERKQTGQATAKQYRTRPELAREMIQIVASWIPQRILRVLGDSEYAGQSISRHLPTNAKLISRMNMKAALYAPAAKSVKRGRRRKKGDRLPSPLQMAQDKKATWIKTTVVLYGKKVKLWYQTIDALWYQQHWRGYKLHLDVGDGQIPISAVLTGAKVHDSQVAIPLMTMTSQRVTHCYELMDAAYDAGHILDHSRQPGHVPIVDPVQHYHGPKSFVAPETPNRQLSWAEEERYQERTMVERVNARLKDEFGGRNVRVRGAAKVMAHLMFGVLALTVDQLRKLIT